MNARLSYPFLLTSRWFLGLPVRASFASLLIALSTNVFAQSGFPAGCGPFVAGFPVISDYSSNGQQLAVNNVIPSSRALTYDLFAQAATCPANTYRLSAASAALPSGVSYTTGGPITAPTITFTGTPTTTGQDRVLELEVSGNGGVNWVVAARFRLLVTSCLDWENPLNGRYSAGTTLPRVVPIPVAGVAYNAAVSFLPNSYPASAYCTYSNATVTYKGGSTPSGLSAASTPGTPLSLTITGTPTADGVALTRCLLGEGSPELTINAGASASISAFCFGSAATVITLGGSPPAGTVGQAYSAVFNTNGTAPTTFSLSSGSLPSGLSLAANGTLSGTPMQAGTYAFTLNVMAANGNASGNFSVTISPAAVVPINTPVPTLSQWGVIALMLLCAGVGIRNRRRGARGSD
jgi:Putative Ig domain/IPTL-CTERM motif